jgi:tRNA A58 N-methylase Trm61
VRVLDVGSGAGDLCRVVVDLCRNAKRPPVVWSLDFHPQVQAFAREELAAYPEVRFIRGDAVGDVVSYVQYNKKDLLGRIREQCEEAYEKGRIDIEQLNQLVDSYERGLNSYTYLE